MTVQPYFPTAKSASLWIAYLLMTGGTVDELKKMQMEFQELGFEVEELINAPLSQYKKRTAIHLAAYNGLSDCLELLLKSGGEDEYHYTLAYKFIEQ